MSPLSVKIDLLTGKDVPDAIRTQLKKKPECPVRRGGWIWVQSGSDTLRLPEDEAGETFLRMMSLRNTHTEERADPWRSVLAGRLPEIRPPDMKDGILRCVILFEAVPDQDRLLEERLMADLMPVERGDVMTETAPGKIVLIKLCADHGEEEIREFAAAVIETVETEAGIPVQAGIGRSVSTLTELHDSYQQAQEALSIGRQFFLTGAVFDYGQQVMERLISAVPAEDLNRIRRELFSPETGKLLTDEMMETVRVFFQNDLNLSTAARQLFVHRNTLIYRLDKIRKITGFDLRRFQDAAVFRLLCRLQTENTDYPRREK